MGSDARIAIADAFKKKTGINLEFTAGRAAELVQKVMTERRAGLFLVDVWMSGPTTVWQYLKPIGALESPEKYLFLPEVLDPKVWWGGQLIWMDKERTFIQFILSVTQSSYKNTQLVRPEEMNSLKDLLNPKWKGKIVLKDPMPGGTSSALMLMLEVLGWDYIRALAEQTPVILRDERLMIEWVARGKYPISIGSGMTALARELKEEGIPIDIIFFKEGDTLSQARGAFTILDKAPHPNATKVFATWVLTREGGTVFSIAEGHQSARLDVPTDHLEAWQIRQPGKKYINMSTEEMHSKKFEMREPVAEILGIIKGCSNQTMKGFTLKEVAYWGNSSSVTIL